MQLNRVKIVNSANTEWLTMYAWAAGKRIRLSLGTKKAGEAQNRADWIVQALREGPSSALWPTLSEVLPHGKQRAFDVCAELAGYTPVTVAPKVEPTWTDLRDCYVAALDAKILDGKFSESSKQNYSQSLKEFDSFAVTRGISRLADINDDVVVEFKTWRKKSILSKSNSGKECKRLSFDLTVLRAVWNHTNSKSWTKAGFSPFENVWPIMTRENKPGAKPEDSTQPFSGLELSRMRAAASARTHADSQGREYKLEHGTDLLAFELLLHTGLRRCDAATLRWKDIRENMGSDGMLRIDARKNGEEIFMPIHPDLARVLRLEKTRRNPSPTDKVLVNPQTGKAYDPDGKRLYGRLNALGKRLGIEDVRPHRFRCTFAVDSLLKGAQPIEIARLLGDKLETVVAHYLPLTAALAKSTRDLLARQDAGIEANESAPAVVSIDRKEKVA